MSKKEVKKIDSTYYEIESSKRLLQYETIKKALNVVRKYIIRENLILVGGMSIDYALRLKDKNAGIYPCDLLPDYDFYSPRHYYDAYEIGLWLVRLGIENVSVINAVHPSTMKVFVDYITVADVTYIPENIFNKLPTLYYGGIKIIHPNFQLIDQHRALSYPLENSPRATIFHRTKKDMTRYDLLYSYYPLGEIYKDKHYDYRLNDFKVELIKINNTCLAGFTAFSFLLSTAIEHGFISSMKIKGTLDNEYLYMKTYKEHTSMLFTLYADEPSGLIKNISKDNTYIYKNRILDKLPEQYLSTLYSDSDMKAQIFHNQGRITAHIIDKTNMLYVCNLQLIMVYMLWYYIIEKKKIYYDCYIECINLIKWASNKYYNMDATEDYIFYYLPTTETYGSVNNSDAAKVLNFIFKKRLNNATNEELTKYLQPRKVYYDILKNKFLPDKYFNFTYDNSEIFNIDGSEVKNDFKEM